MAAAATENPHVCKAAALGDLFAVKDACEKDSSYINQPDEQVFTHLLAI